MEQNERTREELLEELHNLKRKILSLEKTLTQSEGMEETLHVKGELYRRLVEISPDAIVLVDLHSKIILANRCAALLYGSESIGDLIGRHVNEVVSVDDRARVEENIRKTLQEGRTRNIEYTFVKKDGTHFFADVSASAIIGPEGAPQALIAVVRDITERKKAESALRENEQKLRNIVEHSSNLFYSHTVDHVLTYMSPQTRQFFDCEPEEALVRWTEFATDNPINQKGYDATQRAIDIGQIQPPYELELKGKRGRIVWVEVHEAPVVQDGMTKAIVGALIDITERKKAEEALNKERDFRNTLIQASPIFFVAINAEGKTILMNEAMLNALGYEEAEIRDTDYLTTFVPEHDHILLKEIFQKLVESHQPTLNENHVLTKDGQELLVEWHGRPVFKENGAFDYFFGVGIDITERKRMEACLAQLNTCFLQFGADPEENINRLVALCGQLMGATCALYNRLDAGMLCSVGSWNVPHDYNPIDTPQGHICYDVIQKGDDELFVVRNLDTSSYADTDPNVKKYNLHTYVGKSVKFLDRFVGSLCVVYQKDFSPNKQDEWFMGVVAAAIGIEEERKHANAELRHSREMLQLVMDNIPQFIFWKDTDSVYLGCNKNFAKAAGVGTPENIIGKTDYDLAWKEEEADFFRACDRRVMDTNTPEYHIIEPQLMADGKEAWLDTNKIPLHDADGAVVGILGAYEDITERRQTQERCETLNKKLMATNRKLKQLSLKDHHTGLYNHNYIDEVLEREFSRIKRYAHPISVILFDIDYFKSINEVYSHKFGDLILKQFARQLKKLVRGCDILIRYGGEEFMIISPGIDNDKAVRVARRIMSAINLYNFGDKKHTVKLKLSGAVTSYPEDKIVKSHDIIKLADQILSRAKDDGGDRIYTSSDVKKHRRPPAKGIEGGADIKRLRGKLDKLTKQANQSLIEAIFAFARTITLKDHYTGEHVERTVQFATEIARALELPKDEIELIKQASILHDLGKIGISEKILLKKAKLSKKEFDAIKKHPQIGVDIIRPIQVLHRIIPLIFYHHEWFNGNGYPSGLKGDEIPMGARIIAIADAFQALISNRPYRKKAYTYEEAIKIVEKGSGTHFDPAIVKVFLKILKRKK